MTPQEQQREYQPDATLAQCETLRTLQQMLLCNETIWIDDYADADGSFIVGHQRSADWDHETTTWWRRPDGKLDIR